MPKNKDLKRLVRQRMADTGEHYTAALVAIVGPAPTPGPLPVTTELRRARLTELVQLLADKGRRIDAIRELIGALTATEMRSVVVPDDVYDAIVAGLVDRNPKVRWWCIQLLDHVPDERAIRAVVPLLDDPVDRVRRNAVHALGCVACKPSADTELPPDLLERIVEVATTDRNAKVRKEAAWSLACRRGAVPARRRKHQASG